MPVKVINSPNEISEYVRNEKKYGKKIGFVPTMGALHDGHLDLVRTSQRECDKTIVSIFVNPTQFNDPKDFDKYPKTIEKDLSLLEAANCDCLFLPKKEALYPDNYKFKMIETSDSKILCGAFRPGHFDGVLSIVLKLFNIVPAQFAYFGEKDYQQMQLIKGMVEAFFIDTVIRPVPTKREADGLAMSSRNTRLSEAARKKAARIYHWISQSRLNNEQVKNELTKDGFNVEYVETVWGRRFVAAYIEEVRLIDNVKI